MKTKLTRISIDLAEQLEKMAKSNQMSIARASKELADINKKNLMDKKFIREIKF